MDGDHPAKLQSPLHHHLDALQRSWGISKVETDRTEQHFTEAIYHLTKSFDKNRPVIVNDGWEHTVSDIITLHDYEEAGEVLKQRYLNCKDQILTTEVYHSDAKSAFANGYGYRGQPVILSEYGGIAFNNDDAGWGYGNKVNTPEEFSGALTRSPRPSRSCPMCAVSATPRSRMSSRRSTD